VLIPVATGLSPEQHLALAVLRQALADAENDHLPSYRRHGARGWLLEASAVRFWCDVAGLDVDAFRRRARHVLA
jgi:hypothetical protein